LVCGKNPRPRFSFLRQIPDVLLFVIRHYAPNEESNDSRAEKPSCLNTINTEISKGHSAKALLRRAERTGNKASPG